MSARLGVYKRGPVEERFWAKVDKNGPIPSYRPDLGRCWIWLSSASKGYGRFRISATKFKQAHTITWESVNGPVPTGLELDHLCRIRRCVNPAHLEPVTRRINLLRGPTIVASWAKTTSCKNGHPFDESNTIIIKGVWRRCRKCREERNARFRANNPNYKEELKKRKTNLIGG